MMDSALQQAYQMIQQQAQGMNLSTLPISGMTNNTQNPTQQASFNPFQVYSDNTAQSIDQANQVGSAQYPGTNSQVAQTDAQQLTVPQSASSYTQGYGSFSGPQDPNSIPVSGYNQSYGSFNGPQNPNSIPASAYTQG